MSQKASRRYTVKTIKVSLRASESDVVGATTKNPRETIDIARAIYRDLDSDQEHFTILALDRGNRITGYKVVCSGAQDELVVDPRILFRYALMLGAHSIILVHNHPSNRMVPSDHDIDLTTKLIDGGRILGIRVLDHILVGESGKWVSLNEAEYMD